MWLSPVTAALAVVLFAVDKVKEYFAALNEKIREYINTSREIRNGQSPRSRDAGEMAELHDLLNRILGLQEHTHMELNGQRGELAEQRRRIGQMESQQHNYRYQ